MEIYEMNIKQLKTGLLNKDFSDVELVEDYFKRIKKHDDKIKSFITTCEESALMIAKQVDKRINNKEKIGILEGIPITVKDNICTKGIKTTCASKMLEDFIPPYDATVVRKLKESGAIIIGKTNMDEFAMGSSTENSSFSITRNPWDLDKVPGGSSGGAAASVAARFAPLAYGSDTGGSIRQPASFCGCVGIKPTYGLVSRYGLVAFGSSLDQIGPLANSVTDCALGLEAICGSDKLDSTCIDEKYKVDYVKTISEGIKGYKIGIPKQLFNCRINEQIRKEIKKSINILEKNGADIYEFDLPVSETSLSAYYIISSAEASSNLGRYDGVRYGYRAENYKDYKDLILKSRTEGFGDEVKRRIMLGTYVLSSGYYDDYYKKSIMYRKKLKNIYSKAFEKYDLIISPTSPILPFGIGAKIDNPLDMYLADTLTVDANLVGMPALSMACGFSSDKLPIGIQFISNDFNESKIFKTAYVLEKELELNTKYKTRLGD